MSSSNVPWYKRKKQKQKKIEEGLKTVLTSFGTFPSQGSELEGNSSSDPDSDSASSEQKDQVADLGVGRERIRKFSNIVEMSVIPAMNMKSYNRAVSTNLVVDGDSQDFSPATAAWFLGPKAENLELLRELVMRSLEEHADFRKYKHFPLDPKYITKNIKQEKAFNDATVSLRENLVKLCDRLKNSVPFSNFRFQGQMVWDTTIASNVGYIAALLYNQNNVASMASGVTLQLEREVARDLCQMVGYNVKSRHTTDNPEAWGHLPNGGTVANLEAMWSARSVKFNGLTIQKMLKKKQDDSEILKQVYETFTFTDHKRQKQKIKEATAWQLLNLPIDEGIDLFNNLVSYINKLEEEFGHDITISDEIFGWVKKYTLESLGGLGFYNEFREELKDVHIGGCWFCPGSRHYSWDKGANILGIGRDNMFKIPVDRNCRMRTDILREKLEECLAIKRPVIGVTVVYGTTQEGAVDNMEEVLKIRNDLLREGLSFTIHIDGAWGGYFASCVDMYGGRGSLSHERSRKLSECFNELRLSSYFEKQLRLMRQANSITLDPHKSGFCPYPAGGLLYRNGNIRHFLAQKAAYVAHGTENNEEINLFGIDGSKPGAASAGVWLSHKVTGLHSGGYGLLLRQSTFSASVMYTMFISLGRKRDPFLVVPCIPLLDHLKQKWPNSRIRKEILCSENKTLNQNLDAIEFLRESGPDTLINCLSINYRCWDKDSKVWKNNTCMKRQREFLSKLMKRCSHSYEKPSMVDRGIQIILNSSAWELESHQEVYRAVKEQMGLNREDESKLGVILNTCMSPWIRSQKTFHRIGTIIRNELYNAYGAMTDEPIHLKLVSPCIITEDWDGSIFADLEASFSHPSLRYHCVGKYMFSKDDICKILKLASSHQPLGDKALKRKPLLRLKTVEKMKVFDLMTGGDEGARYVNQKPRVEDQDQVDADWDEDMPSLRRTRSVKQKIDRHNDNQLAYESIGMPEVEVEVYYDMDEGQAVRAKMKLKRVLRYHHLTRDFVDEKDYPPTQEYFLYSDQKNAYLSHCPNRHPDFQQQILLDNIPMPDEKGCDKKKNDLYKEALERGVVIYLPEISCGGRPPTKKKNKNVCKDPIKLHCYNAISWSDQGAFTGDMTSIHLRFLDHGVRWFDGKQINEEYEEVKQDKFGYLLQDNSDDSDSSDEGEGS